MLRGIVGGVTKGSENDGGPRPKPGAARRRRSGCRTGVALDPSPGRCQSVKAEAEAVQ